MCLDPEAGFNENGELLYLAALNRALRPAKPQRRYGWLMLQSYFYHHIMSQPLHKGKTKMLLGSLDF